MRLFTIEEANALLPEVRRLFRQIDEATAILQRLSPEVKLAGEHAADGGGGTVYGSQYANALTRFLASIQEIMSYGIEIKDFERGLCDFPHVRDGKTVYLCWQRGEDSIEWWHDIDAGFAGRQPL
ncbi:MAG: DUF2203 domain-containing protein [Blastocatellia bacterium]|nr:DUF2203 domain-containing protein [Blastocatellia bacterium]